MFKTIIFIIILLILINKKNILFLYEIKNIKYYFTYYLKEFINKLIYLLKTNKNYIINNLKYKINFKLILIIIGFIYILNYSKNKILILLLLIFILNFYSKINYIFYNLWNIKNNKFFINKFILI